MYWYIVFVLALTCWHDGIGMKWAQIVVIVTTVTIVRMLVLVKQCTEVKLQLQ